MGFYFVFNPSATGFGKSQGRVGGSGKGKLNKNKKEGWDSVILGELLGF